MCLRKQSLSAVCGWSYRELEDVHEDGVAFLGLLVEADGGPDPVEVGAVWAKVKRGQAATHGEVVGGHGHHLHHLCERLGGCVWGGGD